MSGLTQAGRTMALEYILTTDTLTRPTEWHLSLHTSGGEADTDTFASYTRQSATFTVAGDRAETDAAVSWSVDSGAADFTVTSIGIWDAATGGTQLAELPVTVNASGGGTISFSAGNLAALLLDNC